MKAVVIEPPASWREIPWLGTVSGRGGSVYAIGGAVRDLLLGVLSVDLDLVVTGVPRAELRHLLSKTGLVFEVGETFAVLKWRGGSGDVIDVALPRGEIPAEAGRSGIEVGSRPLSAIDADLARRDFTINAIALDLRSGELIDPHGGQRDLSGSTLRCVGTAVRRFEEDPLRILRGAAFVARFALSVDPATRAAMEATTPRLESVAPERIADTLATMLMRAERPSLGLRLLIETGAMRHVLPEFMHSVGFEQNSPHHDLDVGEHVLLAVDQAARRGASLPVRLAVLMHDLTKPECYSEELLEDGTLRGHFYGHELSSAEAAREALERLRFASVEGADPDALDRIPTLIRHHLLALRSDAPEEAVRHWIRRVGGREAAGELLEVWAADRSAHANGLDEGEFAALSSRIEHADEVPLSDHALALNGREIEERFGASGRAIGEIKGWLLERVVSGEVENRRTALIREAERMLASKSEGS